MIRSLLCILFGLSIQSTFAARIQGMVLDENRQALSFVNIFFQGTNVGTVSNENGVFLLEMPEKQGILEFRYLGYQSHYEAVTEADSNRRIQVVMKPRAALLQETVVDGNRNPAEAIMKEVIASRNLWDIEGTTYQCEVYIKGLQRAEGVPEKIMGQKIDRENYGLDSLGNGIFYLFESVNGLSFQTPSTYQETVRSSRVSGRNDAFTFLRASDLVLDFNESLVPCFDMKRGFVSPIGNSGFFYYHYKLEGSYFEGNEKYYRIRFEPKRANDPAGKGILIIRDSLWYTQSVHLTLYRKNELTQLDSLSIHTEYQLFEGHYLPAGNQLTFGLNILGIGGFGYFYTQYLNYNFAPVNPTKKRRKREVLLIDDKATKRDSVYWDSIRPVPLTLLEIRDYQVKDSVEIQRELAKDSSNSNSIGIHWLWSSVYGTMFKNSFIWTSRSLLGSIQYNNVEGFVIEPRFELREKFQNSEDIKKYTQVTLRYGFSSTRIGGRLYAERYYHKSIPVTLFSEMANITTAMDGDKGMDATVNSLYSLILAQNNLKFYNRTAIGFGVKATVTNGLELSARYSMERRRTLENTTEYSFRQGNSALTPNNFPFLGFRDHYVQLAEFGFHFVPYNHYTRTPKGKVDMGSSWPVLSGKYTLGFPMFYDNVSFQKLEMRVDWDTRLGILGNTKISAGFGTFINKSKLYTPDYFHMNNNPGFYQAGENRMLRMQTLQPYFYSNDRGYVQLHVQHNFDGFLLNKIPGVRRLRAREFIGFQALSVPGKAPYYEFSFGFEQMAFHKKDPGLFRIEFIVGKSGKDTYPAIRLGYSF